MRTPDLCLSINRADPGVRSCRLDPVLAGCWGQRGAPRGTPHPRHIQAAGICPRFWQLQPRAAPAMGAGNRWVGSAECCLGSAPGEGEKRGERGGEAGGKEGALPARTRCSLWRWQSQIFSPRLIPAQNRAPPHASPQGLLLPAPQSRAPTGSGSCSKRAASAQPWRAPRSAPGGIQPQRI